MLERLDRELHLERERIDKQRADDRKADADRVERIETDIRAMRDVMFEPFAPRATPFLPEIPPSREVLADNLTLKGGGAAGIATVGAAGVDVAQDVLAETQTAILPLVPYLDALRWVTARTHTELPFGGAAMNSVSTPPSAMAKGALMSVRVGAPVPSLVTSCQLA